MSEPDTRSLFDGWRLSTRMVVPSLLLLLALQLVGLAVIRGGVDANARAQLAERLAVSERIWARLLEQRAVKLGQGAALLAADYGLRSAIGSDDQETILSALDNHGARIDAGLTALLDTGLAVRTVAHGEDAALRPVTAVLGAHRAATRQGRLGDRDGRRAAVSVRDGAGARAAGDRVGGDGLRARPRADR